MSDNRDRLLALADHADSVLKPMGFALQPLHEQSMAPLSQPFRVFTLERLSAVAPGSYESIRLRILDDEDWERLAPLPPSDVQKDEASGAAMVTALPALAAFGDAIQSEDTFESIEILDGDTVEFDRALTESVTQCERLAKQHGAEMLQASERSRLTAEHVLNNLSRHLPRDAAIREARARLEALADPTQLSAVHATLYARWPGSREPDRRVSMRIGWDTDDQRDTLIDAYWVAALLMVLNAAELSAAGLIPGGQDPWENEASCLALQYAVWSMVGAR